MTALDMAGDVVHDQARKKGTSHTAAARGLLLMTAGRHT
jgi:hypothetical protein